MGELEQEITIERDPDAVWKLVGDFGGVATWFPGLENVRVEGDTRHVNTTGLDIAETMRSRDDATRTLSYSITEIPIPLESHLAEITVHADGAGSRVTWKVTVVPDDLLPIFVDVYKGALSALKEHCES
ncbi:MAG: SRPBCC family protein [Acidimicrobiia bacterium]